MPKLVSNLHKNFLCIPWHQKPTCSEGRVSLIFSEPFLESIPQVVISLMFQCHSAFTYLPPSYITWSNIFPMVFTLNFCVSLLSGSLGISQLLRVGPCRLVKYDGLNIAFVFIVLSNLTCILGKGTVLFTILFGNFVGVKEILPSFMKVAMTWTVVCTVPHFFLVSIVLTFSDCSSFVQSIVTIICHNDDLTLSLLV
jgi:hypothetical protein